MFSKDSKNDSKRGAAEGRDRVPSIISASLRIVGDLVSEGDVQVDGTIEGDVSARSLTVSEGAAVTGQIVATRVCIRGEVHGQITSEKVELGRTAHVVGDIVHQDLSIESGAFLEGHCRRMDRPVLAQIADGRETAGDPAGDEVEAPRSAAG